MVSPLAERMVKLETDVGWIREKMKDFISSADTRYAHQDRVDALEQSFVAHCQSIEKRNSSFPTWIAAACAVIAVIMNIVM